MTVPGEILTTTAANSLGDQAKLVNWLASPPAYNPPPRNVQRIETHISQVFLADDLVYKLKKPVQYDFLDFSTLAAREHACREEVRLSRAHHPAGRRQLLLEWPGRGG